MYWIPESLKENNESESCSEAQNLYFSTFPLVILTHSQISFPRLETAKCFAFLQ